MGYTERTPLIDEIEQARSSKVICYLTSIRRGLESTIASDAVRVFFDHLLTLPERPVPQIDLLLVSNGGESTVPWRLIPLLREFGTKISVLVPFRAYSAATLIALGADEIVMHPFAEMGPIDPTVTNAFNPTDPRGNPVGISVEDVKAYVNFIKTTAGINHEEELIKAIEVLAEKVHPLALGNVERFIAQSRMIARKLLLTHLGKDEEHKIDEIVENMASKLYFHGHPINRVEAQRDLHLKVVHPAPQIETTMWNLYKDFEQEFKNLDEFNPLADINQKMYGQQQQQAPGAGLAGANMTYDLLHVVVESRHLTSAYNTRRRYETLSVGPGQIAVKEDFLSLGWTHFQIP